jgi:hypothetical protein
LDEEKLAEIAERIQVGDSEEGKQAIREVLQLAAASNKAALAPAHLSALVEQTLHQRDHQAEITKAIERFGNDNPDLIEGP